jgi:Ca2+-binding RTX toxin-like protein
MLESLESRRLMTTTLENGVLTVRGSEEQDNVNVWQPAPEVTRVEHNGEVTDFATDDVKSIFVSVGAGDDVVVLGKTEANAKICGGDGNDTLSAGEGNDTIYGDGGDDYLFGRGGRDHLDGGDGTGHDADDIFGGDGLDTVDYSARVHSVRIGLGSNFNDGEENEGDNVHHDIEIAIGGSGDDLLENFGAATACFYGGDGNDTLIGGMGNDTLTGGAGEDILNGAGGFDSYFANDGEADVLICGSGWLDMDKDALDATEVA